METLFHPIVVADSKVEVVEAMNGYTQFAQIENTVEVCFVFILSFKYDLDLPPVKQ